MLSKLFPLLCVCIPTLLFAQSSPDVIIDQEFIYTVTGSPTMRGIDENGLGGGAVNISSPLSQEFTPSLTAMNFFDLYTGDLIPNNGLGVILSVAIRRNEVDSLDIGHSQDLALPDGFDGPARFLFSDIVSLAPGVVHRADIKIIGGDQHWGLAMNASGDAYSGGRLVANVGSSADAWFREGLIIPEPSAKWLLIFGACVLGVGSRAKYFIRSRSQ